MSAGLRSASLICARASLLLALLAPVACGSTPREPVHGLIDATSPGAPSLRMTYLGVGGWIMEHDGIQVLTGPLFSNPGLIRTGLARIASDTLAVDRYLGAYDVRAARAILVGHAHYDHLMDVPRVAAAHALDARIVGGPTVRNTLGSWSGLADRVDVIDRSAAGDRERVGEWMPLGDRLRVMPLRSMHAPHFDGITLYRGTVDVPRRDPPRRATAWLEGETYAFLIDFMDAGGRVTFRVYYQDAVAAAPLGLAPDALIAERPVDVAVIVPATFAEVDGHPEALVRNLRPSRVLLGHWEDFFVPPDRSPKIVPLTDLGAFERRLARVFSGDVWRPEPFTEIRLPAREQP